MRTHAASANGAKIATSVLVRQSGDEPVTAKQWDRPELEVRPLNGHFRDRARHLFSFSISGIIGGWSVGGDRGSLPVTEEVRN